jgi:hypothetical protein
LCKGDKTHHHHHQKQQQQASKKASRQREGWHPPAGAGVAVVMRSQLQLAVQFTSVPSEQVFGSLPCL